MDNTVGSLTQFQKSVIIGSIIGDGYIRCIKGRKNAFMEVNHSFFQREYVDWKYSVLSNITKSKPISYKENGNRISYRFCTKQHPFFTLLLDYFYSKKNKIIPIKLKLDPVSLAVWYMDDGSKCRESDIYLNSQQFDIDSQKNLLNILKDFGVYGRLNKDKSYLRIRILKESIKRFFEIISPYIISEMKYKLSDDPVETSPLTAGG